MAVISVSITESSEQVVAGIPRTIALSTNIPSNIFYTLDGTTPTLSSTIYTGPITLPIDRPAVTLSVFASNGTDSSPIIVEYYTTNMLDNTRLPHANTDQSVGSNLPNLYPFGTNPINPNAPFTSNALSGVTVDDPSLPTTNTGFDGYGNPTGFTNKPFNVENYQISYTTTDNLGQTGHGIGTLPGNVTVDVDPPPAENTQQFSNMFDPRALVIFQDFDNENPNDPPQINKQYYTSQDPVKARDGNAFYVSGLDAPPPNGGFLRSHYNPRDNTMNYYYLDTWSQRWIISKQKYNPSGNFDGNLSGIVLNTRTPGGRYCYEWLPFTRRSLF